MSNWVDTFSPRPRRGELESCMNGATAPGASDGVYEVWCHPADTSGLLDGGIRTVNGLAVSVELIDDSWPFADQLRITVRRGVSTPVGHRERAE